MAAFPASFLKPGTSLAVTLRVTKSVLHERADVYIGQNAVLAGTGSTGPAVSFGFVSVSSVAEDFGAGEQPHRRITAAAARTAEDFLHIAIAFIRVTTFRFTILC
jgi:hypothetical protein